MAIRVLVVEDEAIAADAHATYLTRVAGFDVAGVARSGVEALRLLGEGGVDLVLLDFNLPDGHGLELLQRMRSAGHLCDVIAVTSARDLEMVQRAVAQGVVLYLLKPFTFAGFRAKLEQYAAYRSRLGETEPQVVQDEVDQIIGLLRSAGGAEALPKGMSAETLRVVTECLRDARAGVSASEVAGVVGSSRVTARRYLEHLADSGLVVRRSRYGGGGRPEVEYVWLRT
ncbi:MAG TPA: response regulator [Marmoricola sp.]|jgi:response regulator of citrate/malate metabolism|nr:response regulator [Marmoricola sp.]